MAYDWSNMADVLDAVIDEYGSPDSLVIGTLAVPCLESSLRGSSEPQEWGLDTTYRLSLTVSLSDLPEVPAVRSLVTYRDASYRVLAVWQWPLLGYCQIHLGDP